MTPEQVEQVEKFLEITEAFWGKDCASVVALRALLRERDRYARVLRVVAESAEPRLRHIARTALGYPAEGFVAEVERATIEGKPLPCRLDEDVPHVVGPE